MSFEGYIRKLCKNGHLITRDVYDDDFCYDGAEKEFKEICHICNEPIVWREIIDMTNGIDEANPETKLKYKQKPVYDICPVCNHKTQRGFETYKIPKHK